MPENVRTIQYDSFQSSDIVFYNNDGSSIVQITSRFECYHSVAFAKNLSIPEGIILPAIFA